MHSAYPPLLAAGIHVEAVAALVRAASLPLRLSLGLSPLGRPAASLHIGGLEDAGRWH